MAFLNPMLLLALAAAGIPLAIHFLGRRRPRQVLFSAMGFLDNIRRQQFRRLRFRHWLLLLIRTLLIAFLVLSFAGPSLRNRFGAVGYRGENAIVVLLDDGPSMGRYLTSGSGLDWASHRIEDIRSLIEPNDWAVLVRMSRPDLVHPLNARTNGSYDLPATWSGDGTTALNRVSHLLSRTNTSNREVYVISDLAGPPWANLVSPEWPDGVTGYLFQPPTTSIVNVSVDSISTGNELVRVGQYLNMQAILSNTGDRLLSDFNAALWLNGKRVQQRTVGLDAGERRAISFSTRVDTSGWLVGRIEIDDDQLLVDNTRWFALDVPQQTNVLVIGPNSSSQDYLSAIFASPDNSDPYSVTLSDPERVTRSDFEHADVIILNESFDLEERTLRWLEDALRNGAGVLALVGPKTNLQFANRHVLPLFTHARFIGLAFAGTTDTTGYFALNPPIAGTLIDDLVDGTPAGQPRFATYVSTQAPREDRMISFTNDEPWLVSGRGTAGSGAVMTAGLNPAWGDLAHRGMIVPLLHRLVNQLAARTTVSRPYVAGMSPNRNIAHPGWSNTEIVSPDGVTRALSIGSNTETTTLDLGTLETIGIWRVVADGATQDIFAVNLSTNESILDPMDVATFQRATGLSVLHVLGDDVMSEVDAIRSGTKLDLAFLLLVLVCMALELVLMRGIGNRGEVTAARVA
jgi:hypothetical protein